MAMQFDHMYIECLDSKSSLSKELEAKHLKELVLLHLDLIQQQAEDLAAKDKIIKELTEENEQLRDSLERANREKSRQEKPSDDALSTKSSIQDGSFKVNTHAHSSINNNNNTNNNNNNNNNNTVISGELHSASCNVENLAVADADVQIKAASPVLSRASHLKSTPHSPVSGYCSRSRTVSPSCRPSRNNTSVPNPKSSVTTEIDVNNRGCEPIVSLRHSPRLDSLSTCIVSTEDSSALVSHNISVVKSESLHESSIESSSVIPNRRHSKLSLSRRLSSAKKTQASERKAAKSEPSCSEADSSDGEGWCDGVDTPREKQVTVGLVASRQHPSVSNGVVGKRKSETSETDQSKKSKRTPDDLIVQDYLALSSLVGGVDPESDLPDGTTSHSLRSRGPTHESSASPGPQGDMTAKSVPEEAQVDSKMQLRQRSFSSSSSNEGSGAADSGSTAGRDVSSHEYEKVFVKAACEAAAKLKEQNAIVPPCSLRALRSKEGYLSTDLHYFLPTDPPVDLTDPGDTGLALDTTMPLLERSVEIPSWRVSALTPLYIMEGTENLEDEVFTKRHHKLEQDEKRRKRWDLQRLREQRQYEKLRERYEVRNSSVPSTSSTDMDSSSCTGLHCHLHSGSVASTSTACNGSKLSGTAGGGSGKGSGSGGAGVCSGAGGGGGGGSTSDLWSLWPDPGNALFLEVADKVPVCAFGQPCALLPAAEFSLPWLSCPQQDGVSMRRKRR
ncbi:PEHE domain [Trinorchestia longiramus]|nr:PEHE domain [Trinorchestia longiramus]